MTAYCPFVLTLFRFERSDEMPGRVVDLDHAVERRLHVGRVEARAVAELHPAPKRAAPRLDGSDRCASRRERRNDLHAVPGLVEVVVDVLGQRERPVVVRPGRVDVRHRVGGTRDDRPALGGRRRLTGTRHDGRREERHQAGDHAEAPSPFDSTHEFPFLLFRAWIRLVDWPSPDIGRRTRRVGLRARGSSTVRNDGPPTKRRTHYGRRTRRSSVGEGDLEVSLERATSAPPV